MNEHIEKLAELFKEFPGIGERQAKRFVYFLLSKNPNYISELSKSILNVKNSVAQCPMCFRYFQKDGAEICTICTDNKTDKTTLMVIEKDSDLEALRRSGTYKGMYFVFGGLIPIADDKTVARTRVSELRKRIESDIRKNILKEVILAFSLNPSGEHTDMYVKQVLEEFNSQIKITSLGRGLSTGSELEYTDKDTLHNALVGRK